ncbi:MAG: hypothetical protein MHPSP_003624, partial [Paramarteilia canceri]
ACYDLEKMKHLVSRVSFDESKFPKEFLRSYDNKSELAVKTNYKMIKWLYIDLENKLQGNKSVVMYLNFRSLFFKANDKMV